MNWRRVNIFRRIEGKFFEETISEEKIFVVKSWKFQEMAIENDVNEKLIINIEVKKNIPKMIINHHYDEQLKKWFV